MQEQLRQCATENADRKRQQSSVTAKVTALDKSVREAAQSAQVLILFVHRCLSFLSCNFKGQTVLKVLKVSCSGGQLICCYIHLLCTLCHFQRLGIGINFDDDCLRMERSINLDNDNSECGN